MILSPEQERAVRSWNRGDICVVAGPGSGKTRVLVERMRWLIAERDVEPGNVLAITFTEKAALEMHTRLVREGTPGAALREKFEEARVSTIDAFCHRLVQRYALEAGIDPGFEMTDETEGRELLAAAVEQTLDEAFRKGGDGLGAFLASYGPTPPVSPGQDPSGLAGDLCALVQEVRSHGCAPFLREPEDLGPELAAALEELAKARMDGHLAAIARRLRRPEDAGPAAREDLVLAAQRAVAPLRKAGKLKALVSSIKDDLLPACHAAAVAEANIEARRWLLAVCRQALRAFSEAKTARGCLDFDDVLAAAADLLERPDGPRLTFEHILIDEFQDTNPLQIRLIQRLIDAHGPSRPVRFVVGDINQSIYGFRHSDQNVFREYRRRIEEAGGEVIRLHENFRTRQEVLDAVHRILPGGGTSGVERHRLRSGGRFSDKGPASVEVQLVTGAKGDALRREGLWLAQRLRELRKEVKVTVRMGSEARTRNLEWSDMAVLVRTHLRASGLAASLRSAGVPCRSSAGQSLFRAPETAELAAFLRVLRNPRDETSLAAVLKSPLCGIDDAALLRLRRRYANLASALDEPAPAAMGTAAAARLEAFRQLVRECRCDRATTPARLLLARALDSCAYRSYLASRANGPAALSNVDGLLEWIGAREERGEAGVDAISQAVDRALESRPATPDTSGIGQGGQAVEILTMHGAKGLEFPVVVVASLQATVRGRARGLLFSQEHGIGARWHHPFGSNSQDAAYRLANRDLRQREREESDRLFYVAMTRAEEHLLLSASFPGAAQRTMWCGLVLRRLGLDPNEEPFTPAREERAAAMRFRYLKPPPAATPSGEGVPAGASAVPAPVEPLPASAQADYIAAVTSVSLYRHCPRRYFLERYLQVGDQVGDSAQAAMQRVPDGAAEARGEHLRATEFGDRVHRYLAGELENPSAAVRRVAAGFQDHELGRRVARATRIQREEEYVLRVGDHLLRGTVDLLFEDSEGSMLVDYKTDRISADGTEAAARRHAPQLQLYAAGLAGSGKPPDSAVVFFLRPGQPVEIDTSEPALADARELVRQFFGSQETLDYPLRTGSHCRRCPHFGGACPARLE